jgi:spore coat protein SA
VFHLLPEDEPFSAVSGGAISRVVANLVLGDADAVIVAPAADASWPFPAGQIRCSIWLRRYGASARLRRILLKIKPLLRSLLSRVVEEAQRGDVVWVHNRVAHAILLNKPAARIGFGLVLHMHNHTGWRPGMASLLRGVRVVFVSQALASEATAACPGLQSVEVLHNGADPAIFYPASKCRPEAAERSLQALFVGRLIPEKGAHILRDAMRLLRRRSIPMQARIVGSVGFAAGGVSSYLQELMRAPPDNLAFEGYRCGAALAEIYREADVFCCPSVWNEPFGLVLVEAMATGVPVVASNVGGIPEVLADGGGILVLPNDAQALADALESLTRDGAARLQLGDEALRSFRKNFAWQVVRERYRTILGTL